MAICMGTMLSCGARLGAVCVLMFVAGRAGADVVDSGSSGFTVRTVVEIQALPNSVYESITGGVGKWWVSSHTWSGSSANLSIDARPGGCFCEALPGGGVRHMTVVYADRGKLLRMNGSLGPLQSMAVTGVLTFELSEKAGRTVLVATYAVGGYAKEGLAPLAVPVDGVIRAQVTSLKTFIESSAR